LARKCIISKRFDKRFYGAHLAIKASLGASKGTTNQALQSIYDPNFDRFYAKWRFVGKMSDKDMILLNQESCQIVKVSSGALMA